MCVTMKDASPSQNNDHHPVTNYELTKVTKNCKTQIANIQVKYNGNNHSDEDVQSDKARDNIHKHEASSKTQRPKSYRIKRTGFPLVKPDAIRHHDTVVKCTPSEGSHTTSLIKGVPQPPCPTVRYTSGDAYLHSDSSSTLSSAWDIQMELQNENSETDKAPVAQFRRWLKDMEFSLTVL